ncbi:MAG: hypothetical protein M4D80_40345 [Myxococcota bacterium]|nr:hypothetical protein [Deltaproteobacteria bacterium]MDQ3341447.1 hypothetical protein [Myxococcota bacterium]
MRRLIVLLAACSSKTPPAPTAVPADAAIVMAPSDPVLPDAAEPERPLKFGAPLEATCFSGGKGGSIFRIEVDPKRLRGTLWFSTAGAAPDRKLNVIAKPVGNTTVLLFGGYPHDDLVNVHGVRRPRPRGESLVIGKSVIGSLANIGPDTKLTFDGAVDFVTGASFAPGDERTIDCG